MTTPRGHLSQFTYDALGRLTRDDDPAGGSQTLARTENSATSFTATRTTALTRTSTYLVEPLSTGGTRQVDTAPDGTSTVLQIGSDARTTTTTPDGTVTTLTQGPDPRFGMQAALPSTLTVTTPGGLTSTLTTTRSVTLSDPTNLLSLTSQTDTVRLMAGPGRAPLPRPADAHHHQPRGPPDHDPAGCPGPGAGRAHPHRPPDPPGGVHLRLGGPGDDPDPA